jgi:hypothetical protein
MNIRKILNIKTKKDNDIIKKDIEKILSGCDVIANVEYKEQKENQYAHDGQCPMCRNKTNIVNKIKDVNGKINIDGDFKFGFGSINGGLDINTDEVNHCNNCGNEWKKFKTKYVTETDIIRVALNYLADIYDNPEKTKNHYWKHDTIKVFDNCYAESIKILIKKHYHFLHDTINILTLKKLRENFKSIFD